MSTPDGHLVRKAFLTKYGYSPDLTYDEILCEFQRRYDHAQALRQKNAGLHKIMLIIEGMAESAAKEEASLGARGSETQNRAPDRRERLRSNGTGPVDRRICCASGS